MRGLIVVERVRSESRRSLRVCSGFSSGRFGVASAGCWWLAFVLVAWECKVQLFGDVSFAWLGACVGFWALDICELTLIFLPCAPCEDL